MEKGTLKSGKSNKKVTDPKQAIAIGLSKATAKGAKVPVKKNAPKKTAVKKAAAKKATVKKAAAKKSSTPSKALKKSAAPKKPVKKNSSSKEQIAKKPDRKAATRQVKTRNIPEDIQPENLPPVEEKSPLIIAAPPDPLWVNDERLRAKAALRGNPGNKIRESSVNRSRIKPSGKKPLWPG